MREDNNNSGLPETNELDWQAFCYIAGEMSADEADAFELRLGTDQLAREAVANAMEHSQLMLAALASETDSVEHTVQVSETKPAYAVSGRRKFTFAKSIVAAAAVVLFGAGLFWLSGDNAAVPKNDLAFSSPVVDDDLAAAWADALEELGDSELAFYSHEDMTTDVVYETAEDLEKDSDDWMYVALIDLGEEGEALLPGEELN